MSAASRSGRYGLQRAAASSPISATSRIFPVSRPRISSLVSDFLYVELLQYQDASVRLRHEKRAVLRKFHPIPDLLGNHHPPRLVYRRYGFHHSTINTIMALNKHIYCPVAFAEKGDANAFGVTAMEIIGLEIIGLEIIGLEIIGLEIIGLEII